MITRIKAVTSAVDSHKHARIIVWLLGVTLLGMIVVYGYFLQTAIGHTVSRTDILRDIQNTQSHIAELDSQYVHLASIITLETAKELGFSEVQKPEYVSLSNEQSPVVLLR